MRALRTQTLTFKPTLACVDDAAVKLLELPPLELCEPPVHLEQLLREGSSLVPAAAAPHLQKSVLGIFFVPSHAQESFVNTT